MKNILLRLSFDGSAYHGWQDQKNANTVSREILKAIKFQTGEDTVLTGCSRTDAGVHALEFFANFKTESGIPPQRFYLALNSYLPKDIRIYGSYEVSPDFNARFDCIGKEYIYKIYDSYIDNPFYQNRAYHYRGKIDEHKLDLAAKAFIGTHDFRAFMASGSQAKTTIRTVKHAYVIRDGEFVVFHVYADGFLYNMVRIMAGTLLDISRGKIDKDEIKNIIEKKDRKLAGTTALPHGLYLKKADYNKQISGGKDVF